MDRLRLEQSFACWDTAENIIATGSQTLSKLPDQHAYGGYPIYLESGKGCHVTDIDGNTFLDFASGIGPVVLGYAYEAVDRAIATQLVKGIVFSLPHEVEVTVADAIHRLVPCAEMVRFVKTGSEATSAAVKIARAATGREKILTMGYHGWHDWCQAATANTKGIPSALRELVRVVPYNDLEQVAEAVDEESDRIAAIILEPASFDPPAPGFLQGLRELCTRRGIVLIFDEMWTGFRFHLGGAQAYFGVRPDLATFGKAIANGMPLAAVVGVRALMKVCEEPGFFFSSTYAGEALSLAAAVATLVELETKPVIAHLWKMGRKLQSGYNEQAVALGAPSSCKGFPPRLSIGFGNASDVPGATLKRLFLQESARHGVLFGNVQAVTFSHTEADIERATTVAGEALKVVTEALEEGQVDKRLLKRDA